MQAKTKAQGFRSNADGENALVFDLAYTQTERTTVEAFLSGAARRVGMVVLFGERPVCIKVLERSLVRAGKHRSKKRQTTACLGTK